LVDLLLGSPHRAVATARQQLPLLLLPAALLQSHVQGPVHQLLQHHSVLAAVWHQQLLLLVLPAVRDPPQPIPDHLLQSQLLLCPLLLLLLLPLL
jgi:hypothetical protein